MCASGSGPAGKAIVVPIAEPDGHPVTQGLDDRREIPCVGLVVKDDSSANFRTFPHGVIQGQRIQHSLPDTSVLVIFFDPISIPIVAVAGNLDVEFFQNGFDVIVKRTLWESLPVLVQRRPQPLAVDLLEGDTVGSTDCVNKPDVTSKLSLCHLAYLLS